MLTPKKPRKMRGFFICRLLGKSGDVRNVDVRRKRASVISAYLPFVSTFCFSSSFIFLTVAFWLLSPVV